MSSTAQMARMLEQTRPVVFPRQPERRRRFRHAAPALAFLEAYHRCPECAAKDRAAFALANNSFDTARDRDLIRRDVNEALEAITLDYVNRAEENGR